jgi:cytochrome c-type biogenesis protein CcmE
MKFWIGGGLILAAAFALVFFNTGETSQYYMTIDELEAQQSEFVGKSLRLSGAVVGDTIVYDAETLTLTFTMAHVPGSNSEIEAGGGLAEVLHQAVMDESATRIEVVYVGPLPDLMRDEAQAIVTGQLGEDGIFYADELLLKCPTRYEEEVPVQAEG